MKKILFPFAGLLLLSLSSFAQSNLVIFAEDGDPFYAYVNGIRQNDKPESNVQVTGLSSNVSLRVEFADKALPQLKQNMAVESGFEYAVRIKRNAKKELKLRFFGQTPIGSNSSPGMATVPYHTTENSYNTAGDAGATATMNSDNSVTSTTTNSSTDPGNMSVNINMSGTGVNMNVNGATMNTTTSTTVTSSSSSSSSYPDANNSAYNNNAYNNNNNTTTNDAGCRGAMHSGNFEKMKESVSSKPFSDTKMSTAKVATKNNCLSSAQVKEICKLFNADTDKLEYAKYAYSYCVDKGNYYQVSEAFSFSSTTDDLNKFLEK